MNYLELCQLVAFESRTGQFPGTVSGLTGRPAKIAHWVKQAWVEIQNDRPDWKWMEDTFSGSLLSGVGSYEGSDFLLTRFGQWKPGADPESGIGNFTVQLTTAARATEGEISFREWGQFWRTYDRGSNAALTGKPYIYSVDGQRRLRIWPTPDATYTVRGIYRKSPQSLVLASDAPELPSEFHKVIVWRALMNLAAHDESFDQPAFWNSQYLDVLSDIAASELPTVRVGGALA